MLPGFIAGNHIDADTLLTASSQDPDYPFRHLFDRMLMFPFRFAAAGGWIEADFGENRSFDSVAVFGHNLSDGAGGNVKAGASADPTAEIGELEVHPHGFWVDTGPQTARFVRITLEEPDASRTTRLGQLVVYTRTPFPVGTSYGEIPGHEHANITHQTNGLGVWSWHQGSLRTWQVDFRLLAAEMAAHEALNLLASGRRYPWAYLEDLDDARSWWVRNLTDSWRPAELQTPVHGRLFDARMTFQQESDLVEIAA